MNGEHRRILVNVSSIPGAEWPNGLATDFEHATGEYRIYWIDAG